MFIGGQGVVVVALSFLVKGSAGAFRMYVGEARDEKVLPNVVESARFIWMVSIVFLILGTLALAFIGRYEGMSWVNAFFTGSAYLWPPLIPEGLLRSPRISCIITASPMKSPPL